MKTKQQLKDKAQKKYEKMARKRWSYYHLNKAQKNKKILSEHIKEARNAGVSFDKIVEIVCKKEIK